MKRSILILMILLLLTNHFVFAEGKDISLVVDGRGKELTLPIIKRGGRTFLPLRSVSEELGFEVSYVDATKTAIVKSADKSVEFRANSRMIVANGKVMEFDAGTFISQGRMYVPLRALGEGLGYEVNWDGTNSIVFLGSIAKGEKFDKSYEYNNDVFGYQLLFPNSWKEYTVVKTEGGILSVYDRESFDDFKRSAKSGGLVFSVIKTEKPIVGELDYVILGKRGNEYIVAYIPKEPMYTERTKGEYNRVVSDLDKVFNSFTFK